MISNFIGIEYGRGACATPRNDGPEIAPRRVCEMFPNANWTFVTPGAFDAAAIAADRFGENAIIQKKIYDATPRGRHILIGGDHSVNFGHFAAMADNTADDICLVYVDAHLDAHTPESSRAQASGAPHGANVRGLCGDGDARWLNIQKRCPALRPENLFYLGTRSFEPAEIEFVRANNIFMRPAGVLQTSDDVTAAVNEILERIGDRPYVLSFDFDAIDPKYFRDVWVPEVGGISVSTAEHIVRTFAPRACAIEFVEYAPNGDAQSAKIVRDLIEIATGD